MRRRGTACRLAAPPGRRAAPAAVPCDGPLVAIRSWLVARRVLLAGHQMQIPDARIVVARLDPAAEKAVVVFENESERKRDHEAVDRIEREHLGPVRGVRVA